MVKLDLSGTVMTTEYVRTFAKELPVGVTELQLNACAISTEGMTALAAALPSLTGLQVLRLRGNSIGDMGADALADILLHLPLLQVLDLAWNGISNFGANALLRNLPRMRQLDQLYLKNDSITESMRAALREAGEDYNFRVYI